MSQLTLRVLRWLALAGCVSVPHVLPPAYHWPAALIAVALAACLGLRRVEARDWGKIGPMNTPPSPFTAYDALRAGAKRAIEEIERLGGMEQFCRPGEHRAPVRTEPLPPPSLTAQEWLKKYGRP